MTTNWPAGEPQNYEYLAGKGSEHSDQVAFFAYVNDLFRRKIYHHFMTEDQRQRVDSHNWFNLIFAVPNGANLGGNKRQRIANAMELKAEGLRNGVSDVLVLVPSGQYTCAGIELKKLKGGKVSEEQTAFGNALISEGGYWRRCDGWREAIACLEWYVKGAYGP